MPDQAVAVTTAPSPASTTTNASGATAAPPEPVLVEADLLVEDVSIDGMCGVY